MPAWFEAKRIGSIAAHPFDSAQGRLLQETQGWGTHVLIWEKKTDSGQGWPPAPLRVTTKRATINFETEMKYEWDEAKNRKNIAKHGLSFEDAEQVFAGPCVTFEDDRYAYGEERLITLGLLAGRLVVIAHSPRDEGTRIISMRKGNRREQKIYQKRLGSD